jgi:hypothetical protein
MTPFPKQISFRSCTDRYYSSIARLPRVISARFPSPPTSSRLMPDGIGYRAINTELECAGHVNEREGRHF